MLHRKLIPAALIGAALIAGGTASAQSDYSQALLNLLVKKGLVSSDEAAQLQNQARADAAAAPMVTVPTPAAPSGSLPTATAVAAPTSQSPLSFRIGVANFTPVGFLDFTGVYRSALNGGDIGSSFGSIPYGNTGNGQLSETRLSAKNSRLGLRLDSSVADTKVLGYVEADFLGNQPTNINVASNSDTMRMRVYFVDLKNGPWEVLAGQDWSMMTPNRKGISPMPSDIFYTQDVDTNYQVGLLWARQPQVRVLYHPDSSLTLGLSAENPDQYVGGAEVLPAGFTTTQVDQGANGTATPNLIPDMVGKIAYDTTLAPGMPFHAEVAGLYREFKINTFTPNLINSNATASGFAGSFNSNVGIAPGLALFETFTYGTGAGRYLSTGLGPDVIVTPPDSTGTYGLSAVTSGAGMFGAEWDAAPTSKFFAYYGAAVYNAKYVQLANGSYVGYGYPGSPNSMNHRIEEYTIGEAQTLWKNPSYGDLKVLSQFSYLERTPFFVAAGAPSNAHLGMLYLDLRYDLP
jgi:hypothetical protein